MMVPTLPVKRFYFNPRTHVGCDIQIEKHLLAGGNISIHAPTWGATTR